MLEITEEGGYIEDDMMDGLEVGSFIKIVNQYSLKYKREESE